MSLAKKEARKRKKASKIRFCQRPVFEEVNRKLWFPPYHSLKRSEVLFPVPFLLEANGFLHTDKPEIVVS